MKTNLLELIKTHKNITELSDILIARIVHEYLKEKGIYELEDYVNSERFYYYKVATGRTDYTKEQTKYLLDLLDHIGCANSID